MPNVYNNNSKKLSHRSVKGFKKESYAYTRKIKAMVQEDQEIIMDKCEFCGKEVPWDQSSCGHPNCERKCCNDCGTLDEDYGFLCLECARDLADYALNEGHYEQ